MSHMTILLAEDSPADQKLTVRALRAHDQILDIVVVSNGVEVLDFLFGTGRYAGRDTNEQPALILMDLKMPKMDGFEALQRLRADQRTRLLPVVILTSSKEEQDLIDCYRSGCNSYIRKPVDFTRFADAIGQLKSYWLTLNETPPGGGAK